MTRVLLTAFEPYDAWNDNASWLALVELTKDMPRSPDVTTRLYPVDFTAMEQRLRADLRQDFDLAIHLGQAPASTLIQLESVALNIAQDRPSSDAPDWRPLVAGGPTAYQTRLPVQRFAGILRQAGIPAAVSFHAGTYLCNGIFYMSQYVAEQMHLKTQSAFLHVPLATQQVAQDHDPPASLPAATTATALRLILSEVAGHDGNPEPQRR